MPVHCGEHVFCDLLVVEPIFFGEVFQIPGDDREGSAEFMRSICDEILSDLVGFYFGSDVPHDELNFQSVSI